jgi:hypothetical protein
MPVAETNSPTWASNIQLGVQTALRNTAVALPGIVVSYDEFSQTATVQPAVNRLVPSAQDADEDESETIPAVQHVPVCWLVGRGIQVKATLEPGDTVLLIAADRDFSAWSRSGSTQDPDDVRIHHWQNAIAIPGLVPDSSPYPEPGDAAALASGLDAIFRPISALPEATNLATLLTAVNGIINAVKLTYPPVGALPSIATVGSIVLKLEE